MIAGVVVHRVSDEALAPIVQMAGKCVRDQAWKVGFVPLAESILNHALVTIASSTA